MLRAINSTIVCVLVLASAAIITMATPQVAGSSDEEYKDLIGEWSGVWPGMSYDRGTVVIHEIDTEKLKARVTLMVDRLDSGHEEHEIVADFIEDSVPTIKFRAVKNDFTCVYRKRAKKLDVSYEGDSRGVKMSNSVKMEKRKQLLSNIDKLLEDNPLPEGKKSQAIKIAENDNATISLIRATEGAGLGQHFHSEHDETMYVIKGRGELFIDGKWVEMHPGSIHFNPIGKTHTNRQTGSEQLVFISMFSPGMKYEDRHFVEQ
ncbi:MAG: cupin domain-containing protein [Deferrisomatales bacterium]|nr:cupin domain-containing protein [Deferrisomatales bacterium]